MLQSDKKSTFGVMIIFMVSDLKKQPVYLLNVEKGGC